MEREVFYLNSVADVWDNVLTQMRGALSDTTINTWFDEIDAVDIHGNTLILHCGNDFKRGYIKSLFTENIQDAMKNLFSRDFEIKVLDDAEYRKLQGRDADTFGVHTSARFTFDTFVVGPSNKLAWAASKSVAMYPTRNYNPLLIYGESGLGKTHLIYAIANEIHQNFPRYHTIYVKGDELANELVDAIQAGRTATAEMRDKYRKADVLLVDDVQFIAGKKQTQEEFFHTFNSLYESGRQIVLTSDRPPHEITLLEERLRTRFEWGLIVDVEPPDFETRVAIIRSKAASLGITFPDTVSSYIAENVTSNVRQLEGTVNKVLAYRDLLDDNTDKATVRRAMQDILKQTTAEYVPTPQRIIQYVSHCYDLAPDVVTGQSRNRNAATARQVAMYLIRTMTNLSQDEIGQRFNGRDHSTVIYSLRQTEVRMRQDPAFANTVREIKTNMLSEFDAERQGAL